MFVLSACPARQMSRSGNIATRPTITGTALTTPTQLLLVITTAICLVSTQAVPICSKFNVLLLKISSSRVEIVRNVFCSVGIVDSVSG